MAAIPVNLVIEINLPGQPEDGTCVRVCRLKCGNTIADVSGAGFLNPWLASQGGSVYQSDFWLCACSDGNALLRPSINNANGVVTLQALP